MARPFKKDITKKHDRIIAKVYEQFYRWGFSSTKFETVIADAAFNTLKRGNKDLGNAAFQSEEEDKLSTDSVEKIYKCWARENNSRFFSRRNHNNLFLRSTSPKEKHLYDVACFFMTYMNQKPERCIFKDPPRCPIKMIDAGIWWRFFNGELDGDPVLASKAIKRIETYPKIKISPPNPSRIKK